MFTSAHFTGHKIVMCFDIMKGVAVKYDVLTAVLSLPPLHEGAVNISQKLIRQGIRSADH
jgi:hypothetical protein